MFLVVLLGVGTGAGSSGVDSLDETRSTMSVSEIVYASSSGLAARAARGGLG